MSTLKAGTAGHDEIAQAQQRFVILPGRDIQKRIRAQQEIQMRARAVEFLLEVPHRIHRIKYFAARNVRRRIPQATAMKRG